MKTVSRNLAIVALCLVVLAGCGVSQQIKDNPVKGSFYVSLATFNDALESYLNTRPMLTSREVADIEPVFHEASIALDLWGAAVKAGDADAYEQELAYKKIKAELFRMLFRYGVLEIK